MGIALTSWGNALLDGRVRPDDVADLAVDGREHRLLRAHEGVAGEGGAVDVDVEELGLAYGLAQLRSQGTARLRLVLPVPGDALGLSGPASVTERAVAAGAAVLTVPPETPPTELLPSSAAAAANGTGSPSSRVTALVPETSRAQVLWHTMAAAAGGESALPDLPTAERALKEGLIEVTETLVALDVARSDPRAAEALASLREDPHLPLAPGHPARGVRVLFQAWRLLAIVDVATRNEGGAVTRGEMSSRREALSGLAATARHALAAAASAVD